MNSLRRSLHLNDGAGSGDSAATVQSADGGLVLTDLDKQFLQRSGIAVDKLDDDPVELKKAVNLLASETTNLVKAKAELEKRIRTQGRQTVSDQGSDVPTTQKPEGLAPLINLLHEKGLIDDKTVRLLSIGDPEKVSQTLEIMELVGGGTQTPANSDVTELKNQVAQLTKMLGGQGILQDASQGADPALTTENELAKLGLLPKFDGISDMEKIQKDREQKRAEATRQGRDFR